MVGIMSTKQTTTQPEEPITIYILVEDELNILDKVFDGLFEQI